MKLLTQLIRIQLLCLAVSIFFLKLIPTFFFSFLNKVQGSTILHWATRVKVFCLCSNVTTYNQKLWAMIAINRVLKKRGSYPILGGYINFFVLNRMRVSWPFITNLGQVSTPLIDHPWSYLLICKPQVTHNPLTHSD